MSDKKANVTLVVLSLLLVATWVWFFVAKNEPLNQSPTTPVSTSDAAK